MGTIASQISSLTIVFSTVYSDADQRKHQSSASLAFVRGIHRGPVNSLHKWPVMRKMLPFDDVTMKQPTYKLMITITLKRNSSFWWIFCLWQHCQLSKWQLPVQPVIKFNQTFPFWQWIILVRLDKGAYKHYQYVVQYVLICRWLSTGFDNIVVWKKATILLSYGDENSAEAGI